MEIETGQEIDALEQGSILRVLLAEDDPDTGYLLSLLLKRAGFEVTIASDGAECLRAAQTSESQGTPFDLVLMDLRMPRLSGLGAARSLRAAGFSKPIVAMTAASSLGQRLESIYCGCDEFLAKATINETLIPTVKRLIH